jgi:hypothetical protein
VFTNQINEVSFTELTEFYSLCSDVHSSRSRVVRPSTRPIAALASPL